MKTVAEEMRATLNLLERSGAGQVREPDGWWDEHDLEEFKRALELYTEEPWIRRNEAVRAEITAVFEKSLPPMDRSVRVWRGMAFESWNVVVPDTDFRYHREIGFGDRYVSATYDSDTGTEYMSQCPGKQCLVFVLFAITTKVGARGADVARFMDGDEFLKIWEAELVLDRNSRFRVVSKTKRPNKDAEDRREYWDVELEQVR